jgi:hypothetical protein
VDFLVKVALRSPELVILDCIRKIQIVSETLCTVKSISRLETGVRLGLKSLLKQDRILVILFVVFVSVTPDRSGFNVIVSVVVYSLSIIVGFDAIYIFVEDTKILPADLVVQDDWTIP